MDFATLGLAADSSGLDKGTAALDRLTSSAKKAQAAASGMSGAARATSAATSAISGSSNSAAAALNNEAAAATKAAAALRTHAAAANQNARAMMGAKGNTANIAAQLQDVAVSAQMGMGPMQIALQQGTQLAAVISAMDNPIRGLGAALMSVISPASLLTIGIIALVAAGLQAVDWPALAAAALNALASVMQTIAPYAVGLAAALALLYAPAIIGGVVSLIALLGRLAVAAGIAAAAMAAANPALALVAGIVAAVAAANIFRDELTRIFGVDIVGAAKTGANFVIGAFVAAFEDLKFVWNQFPNIVGAAAVGAANAALSGIQAMLNAASGMLDAFIDKVNGALSMLPGGFNIGKIGSFDLGQIANPYADALGGAAGDLNKARGDALSRDYLGEFGTGIANGASAASAKLKELAANLTSVDEKAKKGGGGKSAGEKFDDIVKDADAKIAALRAEQQGFGQTAEAAARLRYEQELLNRATQAGLALDPQQIALLKSKAAEMASVEAATKRASATQEAFNTAGQAFGGVLKGLLDGTMTWKDALTAIIPIVLKLLNSLNVAGGGKGIFGGGFLQSILQGVLGFAKGGYTGNGAANSAAGVVHGKEYVFSAKATARIGKGNLDALHGAAKGYAGGGYVAPAMSRMQAPANDQPMKIELVSRFDADGGFDTAVERTSLPLARAEAGAAAGRVAKAVPAMTDRRSDERQYRRLRPASGL
ncbi:MAG: phage tail length tape measure family protein [bacterium]|nr:phage tail length tape measure family protein [bacterium]